MLGWSNQKIDFEWLSKRFLSLEQVEIRLICDCLIYCCFWVAISRGVCLNETVDLFTVRLLQDLFHFISNCAFLYGLSAFQRACEQPWCCMTSFLSWTLRSTIPYRWDVNELVFMQLIVIPIGWQKQLSSRKHICTPNLGLFFLFLKSLMDFVWGFLGPVFWWAVTVVIFFHDISATN